MRRPFKNLEDKGNFEDKKEIFSEDYFYGRINSNYYDYDIYDRDQRWAFILRRIKAMNCRGKILDIGCAFGFFLKRTASIFDGIHGIDISEFAIKKAKEQIPSAELLVLDIEVDSIPYSDNYFDVITAFDVLEHTQSVDKSVSGIVPKLKKGGYLIVSLPLKDIWGAKIFSFFDKDISHIDIPTKKQMFNIVEKNGLKVIEKHFFFSGLSCRIPFLPFGMELYLQKK